jgi:hypothetical protein
VKVRVASVVLLLTISTGCVPRVVRVQQPLPTAVQLELASIPRVWIAGFVVDRPPDVDLNDEAVRVLRDELRSARILVLAGAPVTLAHEDVFSDDRLWRRLGEEHGFPLIVTGSIKLLLAPPRIVHRGRRDGYVHAGGRILRVKVVLVDGTTGRVVATQELPARWRYGIGRFSSDVSLYVDLLHQTMPDWLRAISVGSRRTIKVNPGGVV